MLLLLITGIWRRSILEGSREVVDRVVGGLLETLMMLFTRIFRGKPDFEIFLDCTNLRYLGQ